MKEIGGYIEFESYHGTLFHEGALGLNCGRNCLAYLIEACGIDRKVSIYDQDKHDNVYVPLYEEASSKLARKTHVDMMSKVQVNLYAAGLHREGSSAVNRYTNMEIKDHFALMNVAFDQKPYKVDADLNIIEENE